MSEMTEAEKAQIVEKWAGLEKMFRDKGVHDICLQVLGLLLDEDGVNWRQQWNPDLAATWWAFMEAARTAKTHRKALDDQLLLAAFLHQRLNRLELAAGLVVLIDELVLRWQLVDINVKSTMDQLKVNTATGAKERPLPAKVGDKPPADSLRPDQLNKGPRRI